MLSNLSRIIPPAHAEKHAPPALPKHQAFAVHTSAVHTSAHTITAHQNSSDYSVQRLSPLVTLHSLHQDFTQSTRSTSAVAKPVTPLPSRTPTPLLKRINAWINRRDTSEPIDQVKQTNPPQIVPSPSSSTGLAKPRINQRGLALLRQFEPLPSYSEQTIREIEQAVLRQVKVPLTANQFAALVSLTYSLGEANLRRSTLLKYLNAGRYQAAAREFDRWVYVGPNRRPDLVLRRAVERNLFLQND